MEPEIKTIEKDEQIIETLNAEVPVKVPIAIINNAINSTANQKPQDFRQSRDGGRGRGGRRPQRFDKERIKPEFDTKIINIRRVTRVASGGRRFTFSVAVVSGDKKGRVGVGLGKAGDTSLAIDKATRNAKKNMIRVRLSSGMNIPHAVEAKYCGAKIMIIPARGRGVVAGSSARNVIELAGIKDVCAKILSGSKNKLNIARVAVKALSKLSKHPRNSSIDLKVSDTIALNNTVKI